MLNKKYYQIQIVNNQTGEIIQDKDINNSNMTDYTKQVLRRYGEAKFKYKNTDTTISVLRFENNNVKTMYQKVYHSEKNDEQENLESSETILMLYQKINAISDQLLAREKDIFHREAIYDKQQDILLHTLENLKRKNIYEMTKEEKDKILQIAVDIQDIRNQRRAIKNEGRIFDSLRSKGLINKFSNINSQIYKTCTIKMKQCENTSIKCKTGQENKLNKYKEIPYKNFKDRIRIMKEMQRKFQNVRYDNSKKIVFCYDSLYK